MHQPDGWRTFNNYVDITLTFFDPLPFYIDIHIWPEQILSSTDFKIKFKQIAHSTLLDFDLKIRSGQVCMLITLNVDKIDTSWTTHPPHLAHVLFE